MDDFLRRELNLAESLLVTAKENFRETRYEDAEAFARMALDGFLFVRDNVAFFQRAFQGIHETSGIAAEARRLWIESERTPSPEDIDQLREQARQHVDELDRGFCNAVRSAINGPSPVK